MRRTMVKSNKLSIFLALLMLAFVPFVAATCTYTALTDGGSDYYGVLSNTTNTTIIAANETFTAYTAFTPRLNFTIPVYDVIVGQTAGSTSSLHWETHLSPSTTLILTNATSGAVVGTGNYTLVNTTTRRWVINWTTSTFAGTDVNVTFNRTFVKCGPSTTTPTCDDLITSPGTVYTGSSTSSWIVQSTPTALGEDVTFRLNNVSIGNAVRGQNWAVTWDYTEKSCIDQGCSTAVNATIFNVLATMFMIGMLVFIAFSIKNGADTQVVITTVVVFLIMLVALQIINGIITGICAS